MGSKFARPAWGTKPKARAAAPGERAGIERPPVAARLPAPANPFNRVLRSIELSQAPNEVKRASQTDGDQPPLFASGMPRGPLAPPQDPVGESSPFRAITSIYGPAFELNVSKMYTLINDILP